MPDRMYQLATVAAVYSDHPRWTVEIDHNNDGNFDDALESLEDDLDGFDYVVGKDKATQLVSMAVGGRARAHVKNDNGYYSLFNAASPLTGMLLPHRKARIASLTPSYNVLFTGWTEGVPKASASQGAIPSAEFNFIGALAVLGNPNVKIRPAALHHVRTGVVINAILDAAGWPAAARIIDAGDMFVGDWCPDEIGVLEALQQIADIEGGTVREGKNWDIVFESRYHRLQAARSLAPQASFSDAVAAPLGYDEIAVDAETVYNRVEVTATKYVRDAAVTTLYLGEPMTIPGSSTVVVIAEYPSGVAFADGLSHGQVTLPGSSFTVTPVVEARRVKYTVTNNVGTAQYIQLGLAGFAYREGTKTTVVREDLASQAKYGLNSYPFPSPWFANEAYATGQAEYAINRYKEPLPQLRIGFPPGDQATLDLVAFLQVSDMVAVVSTSLYTQLGISGNFYVEQTSLKLAAGQLPRFTVDLSQAEVDPGFLIFDIGKFDEKRFGR